MPHVNEVSVISQEENLAPVEEPETKLLGAHVDLNLYWLFKKMAATRNESMKEAIDHAARLYIDTGKGE